MLRTNLVFYEDIGNDFFLPLISQIFADFITAGIRSAFISVICGK